MTGLELSKRYYEDYGRPMLEAQFPDLMDLLAVAFTGSGSEHYGYDDEVSRDHDFEPGFCIFLPNESLVSRRSAFLLERAYAKLPKEYLGFRRLPISPVGGNRHGVMRTGDFFLALTGSPDGALSAKQWLSLPDWALAEATNGEVWFDRFGEFTRIRQSLSDMPEDIRLKRLAGNLLMMGQSGQYNYPRCLKHGEPEAAQLACIEFVYAALRTAFLLRKRYLPYYKWSFRALREVEGEWKLSADLKKLLTGDNSDARGAETKAACIESVASVLIKELRCRSLSAVAGNDLETHAYEVNNRIADGTIRNLHILSGV